MNTKKDNGESMIYSGFAVLGGILFGIWGFTANRFQYSEIIMLIFLGIIAGIALGLVCNGIILSLKK